MPRPNTGRPDWWDWELELTPHVIKRMRDRDFTEVDLRAMLHEPASLRPDIEPGRWVVETRHERSPWEVILEPDQELELLVVITAYPAEPTT